MKLIRTKSRGVIIALLLLSVGLFGQVLKSDLGYKTTGAEWTRGAIIDTTTGTSQNYVFYLAQNDYVPLDINPLAVDTSGAIKINSDRLYVGTVYVHFDNQGTASPTTDSVLYTIKAYPGILATRTEIASAKWGSAITLETIRARGDYFTFQNVYLTSTKYKHFAPEVIKIEIAPIGDKDCDDSTFVAMRLTYPTLK